MTKKELIAALANVNDDAVILFGMKESMFFGKPLLLVEF